MILALDLSKAGTGWAAGDATSPPRSGVQRMAGETRGAVGLSTSRWLAERLDAEKPTLVVYEEPLFAAHAKASAAAARMLIGMAMVVETVCAGRKVATRSVAIPTWRKAFLGKGNLPDAKVQAVRMCQSLGWTVDADHNRAEACGVWAWAHIHHGDAKGVLRLLSRGGLFVRG